MKKIFKFVAISFAVLAGACTNEVVESPLSFTRELTFKASREGVSPDTKTVRMDDGSTWWNASEEISVFYGSGSAGGSKFTSQNTSLQEIVEFTGNIQMSGSGKEFWAVYPYSQDNACDGSSITTVIPAVQTASEGNFSGDAFPAIAKSKTLDLAFGNICGGAKFSVTRNDINYITFKGNNGEAIAGTVKVSFGSDGKPTVLEIVNGVSEVTLKAPEGECFKAKKYYFITLLPGTLSRGFTMTFNATSAQGVVVSEKPQTVKRSVFGVLNRIDSQVDEWVDSSTPKGWDVFIWHDVTFKYDNLTSQGTYTGESGSAYAPRLSVGPVSNKDLNVADEEFSSWVLADKGVNMSTQDFLVNYDTYSPSLILTKDWKEPGSVLPQKDNAVLVDIGDLITYYSRSGTGLTLTKQSPLNWQSSSLGISLSIDRTFLPLNDNDVHYVYVVYPAKDNTKNIDVIVKFSFKILPHDHEWTILKKYNEKAYWGLNSDCVLGTQNELVERKPAANEYYGDEPYKTYGAIKMMGLETDLRSAIFSHFNASCWKQANENSDYTFTIINYKNDVVDIVDRGTTTGTGADAGGHAYVTISGTDLKIISNFYNPSPEILIKKPAGINIGQDILVEVKERCTDIIDGPSIVGYYYVVVEDNRPYVRISEVKLGDFSDVNDYAYVTEFVKGVYESDAADAPAVFEWDANTRCWKLGPSASIYGITDATKINFKINKLIYGKNEYDTEDSFHCSLWIFRAGDYLAPWPIPGPASETGIEWRNYDSIALTRNKVAGFELEVFYDYESLTKGEGEVTVMKTGSKPHPNHRQDDSLWE